MATARKTAAVDVDDEDTVGVNVPIPTALHRKLRIRAIQEDMTLAEAIAAAVKEWTR
jgi:hypothetical protein